MRWLDVPTGMVHFSDWACSAVDGEVWSGGASMAPETALTWTAAAGAPEEVAGNR